MGGARDGGQVGDGADGVGRMGDGDQPGARRQLPFEIAHVQGALRHADIDEPHDRTTFLQREPGRHVGVVLQPGDQDLVSRA